jgi:hypothetical protein
MIKLDRKKTIKEISTSDDRQKFIKRVVSEYLLHLCPGLSFGFSGGSLLIHADGFTKEEIYAFQVDLLDRTGGVVSQTLGHTFVIPGDTTIKNALKIIKYFSSSFNTVVSPRFVLPEPFVSVESGKQSWIIPDFGCFTSAKFLADLVSVRINHVVYTDILVAQHDRLLVNHCIDQIPEDAVYLEFKDASCFSGTITTIKWYNKYKIVKTRLVSVEKDAG